MVAGATVMTVGGLVVGGATVLGGSQHSPGVGQVEAEKAWPSRRSSNQLARMDGPLSLLYSPIYRDEGFNHFSELKYPHIINNIHTNNHKEKKLGGICTVRKVQ